MPATQASDGNKIGDFMLYRQKVVLFDSGSFFFLQEKKEIMEEHQQQLADREVCLLCFSFFLKWNV